MTPVLDAFAAGWLRVQALVDASREAQWQVPPVQRPREDTTERSKGVTGDPTPRAALDGRRMRLRERVVAAERAQRLALRQLAAAAADLSSALRDFREAPGA